MSALTRGLVAGAVGTTALNAVTYADMLLQGRTASDAPQQTAEALLERLGGHVAGSGEEYEGRRTALGQLSGYATGLAVGVLTSFAHRAGYKLPGFLGGAASGAIAMVATDVPQAALGISDPRDWGADDWYVDVVPHLAYGLATHATVQALSPQPGDQVHTRASTGLVLRSLVLGLATGGRSSLGIAAPVLTDARPDGPGVLARIGAVSAYVGESVMDKKPGTPSRLEPGPLGGRIAAGGAAGAALAKRDGSNPSAPAVAGALGSFAGSHVGLAWRTWAASKASPFTADWQAALVEDGVSVVLALVACLPGRRGQRTAVIG